MTGPVEGMAHVHYLRRLADEAERYRDRKKAARLNEIIRYIRLMSEQAAHTLSDSDIAEFWPDCDNPKGRQDIRAQFDAMMAELALGGSRA